MMEVVKTLTKGYFNNNKYKAVMRELRGYNNKFNSKICMRATKYKINTSPASIKIFDNDPNQEILSDSKYHI